MLIGPVLGPMVICGVCFLKQKLDFLQKIGVKDSKKLSPAKRQELAKIIIENCHSHKIKIIDVKEIDNREDHRITLNRLEVLKFADLINE